jgi:NTE family protein
MGWGLALSGGGILGAAHLGVVRALREWGLQPDVWAGTSAGGIVAGTLAAGASLDDVTAFGAKVSARPLQYLRPRAVRLLAELLPDDPLPPADSLLDSTAFVDGLADLCPVQRIEDWPVPTALTAVDLAALEGVAFVRGAGAPAAGRWRRVTSGPLRTALAATMAMPGVYSPVHTAAGFLVDGGVADTLPVDWAAALGADRVLAVDVAASAPGLPARAGILWSLARSAAYATATLSALREPPRLPVLTLTPDTAGVPAWGFSDYARLVAAGYAAAENRRDEIRAFLAG